MSFQYPMAHFYDLLNDGADYTAERDWIVSALPASASCGLDLGCGTASLAILLSHKFNMTGVDLSEEMLAIADEKAFSSRARVRFVCQDITSLSLGTRYDFCLCLHDTLNYILKTEGIARVFSRVYDHLNEGGVFLFDFSKKQRFEEEYGNGAEVLEREGLFCVWEKEYVPARRVCDFAFHFFEEGEDGKYTRSTEFERQRLYAPKTMETLCRKAGFSVSLLKENETHYIYKAEKRG